MALRPITLDAIGKLVTPSFTEPVARIFIFDQWQDQPAYAIAYIGSQGQPVVRIHAPLSEFTKTRFPRREPYTMTTSSGEQWSFHKGGCGCGNPIKRLAMINAVRDIDSFYPTPTPEPVGG